MVLIDSRSCAVPQAAQAGEGPSVAVGYTSRDALTCWSTIVFCGGRHGRSCETREF